MKNIKPLLKTFIAHRGLFNNKDVPENSVLAFKRAINKNYSIELDVHLTKDEKLVVFHDYNLKRMCKVNKIIEDLTYDEILKYNLLDTKYKVPLLSNVLKLIDGKVFLLIEVKTSKFNGKIEKYLIKLLDDYKGNFAVQSFNPASIYYFKIKRKNYLRGLLSSDFKRWKMNKFKKMIEKKLLLDVFLKTDFISYDVKALPNKYVTKKRKVKPILGWTIKTIEDYEKYKKYVDECICEGFLR